MRKQRRLNSASKQLPPTMRVQYNGKVRLFPPYVDEHRTVMLVSDHGVSNAGVELMKIMNEATSELM